MPETSAGILLYRRRNGAVEVLLVHPGGPFWASKDEGAWSIPKGLLAPGEDAAAAALREFAEETGYLPSGPLQPLGTHRQPSGKRVVAFALEGDFDPAKLRSNTFTLEWPPRSGRFREVPEADRAGWFGIEDARRRILRGQAPILDKLVEVLAE
ncbi:MAG TPA: NUDIX domain-containing protein [Alphaproteobacteria bacterium]|nr:NUDIX domain-containing protein [Alphaproteobacteria bacterium]